MMGFSASEHLQLPSRPLVATWAVVAACGLATLGCGADCDDYLDELPGSAVELHIHNQRAEPIFLDTPGCTSHILPISVRPVGGSDLAVHRTGCGTCEQLQAKSSSCEASCAIPPVILVGADGTYVLSWSAQHYARVEMPESCYFDGALSTCPQRVNLTPGSYEITINATSDCNDGPSTPCTCDSSTDGWCQVSGFGSPSGDPVQASATFEYPPSGPVDITVAP